VLPRRCIVWHFIFWSTTHLSLICIWYEASQNPSSTLWYAIDLYIKSHTLSLQHFNAFCVLLQVLSYKTVFLNSFCSKNRFLIFVQIMHYLFFLKSMSFCCCCYWALNSGPNVCLNYHLMHTLSPFVLYFLNKFSQGVFKYHMLTIQGDFTVIIPHSCTLYTGIFVLRPVSNCNIFFPVSCLAGITGMHHQALL
jgi:hypothetical protein